MLLDAIPSGYLLSKLMLGLYCKDAPSLMIFYECLYYQLPRDDSMHILLPIIQFSASAPRHSCVALFLFLFALTFLKR